MGDALKTEKRPRIEEFEGAQVDGDLLQAIVVFVDRGEVKVFPRYAPIRVLDRSIMLKKRNLLHCPDQGCDMPLGVLRFWCSGLKFWEAMKEDGEEEDEEEEVVWPAAPSWVDVQGRSHLPPGNVTETVVVKLLFD